MNNMNKMAAIIALAGLLLSGPVKAALVDRGGGMLYDTVLDITWLQDANYAKTSGYDEDGRMTWWAAKTWADNLVYGGHSDWRLAANLPVGADWNVSFSYAGDTDAAFNITSPHSELAYMYYVNLGLNGKYSTTGVLQQNFGVHGDGASGGQENVGLVKNLQSGIYWSGTSDVRSPSWFAWTFRADNGDQSLDLLDFRSYAWAVRTGDVAPGNLPEPTTSMLLVLGLAGMVLARRYRASRVV